MIFLVYGIIGLLQTFGIIPANFLPYNDAIYSLIGSGTYCKHVLSTQHLDVFRSFAD